MVSGFVAPRGLRGASSSTDASLFSNEWIQSESEAGQSHRSRDAPGHLTTAKFRKPKLVSSCERQDIHSTPPPAPSFSRPRPPNYQLTLQDVASFSTFLVGVRVRLHEKGSNLRRRHSVLSSLIKHAPRARVQR